MAARRSAAIALGRRARRITLIVASKPFPAVFYGAHGQWDESRTKLTFGDAEAGERVRYARWNCGKLAVILAAILLAIAGRHRVTSGWLQWRFRQAYSPSWPPALSRVVASRYPK
jgi:hypothetical protein